MKKLILLLFAAMAGILFLASIPAQASEITIGGSGGSMNSTFDATCGGNCPSNRCQSCPCGNTPKPINVRLKIWDGQVDGWMTCIPSFRCIPHLPSRLSFLHCICPFIHFSHISIRSFVCQFIHSFILFWQFSHPSISAWECFFLHLNVPSVVGFSFSVLRSFASAFTLCVWLWLNG